MTQPLPLELMLPLLLSTVFPHSLVLHHVLPLWQGLRPLELRSWLMSLLLRLRLLLALTVCAQPLVLLPLLPLLLMHSRRSARGLSAVWP